MLMDSVVKQATSAMKLQSAAMRRSGTLSCRQSQWQGTSNCSFSLRYQEEEENPNDWTVKSTFEMWTKPCSFGAILCEWAERGAARAVLLELPQALAQLLRGDGQRDVGGDAGRGLLHRQVAGGVGHVGGLQAGGAAAQICWPLRAGVGRLTFISCVSLFVTVSHWGAWDRLVWIRCWRDRNLRLKRWFSSIFGNRRPFHLGWVLVIWRSCRLFKRKDLDTGKYT